MKEKLYIENFGPLKKVEIENIKPMTVFIGESGSGKSTIMKVLSLCRWIYKMQNIRSYLKHSNISKSPFRFRMDSYINNCGFDKYIKHNTVIKYITSFDSTNSYELILKKSKSSLSINLSPSIINNTDIIFNKISFISETRNIIPLWADRGASLVGGYLGFYFHETYNDFDLASEYIQDLNIDFLDIKFSVKKKGSQKKYSILSQSDNSNFEIELKNSSSGTQTSIPILLISKYFSQRFDFREAFNRSFLSYLSSLDKLTDFKPIKNLGEMNKKVFIHIEEPELSLYPDAQCELINSLVANSFHENENDIELLLSTHSPYIINHLNLLIKAYDKGTKIKGANINYDNITVYHVIDGELEDLMVQNEHLVNTNPLSETINSIYDSYNKLG